MGAQPPNKPQTWGGSVGGGREPPMRERNPGQQTSAYGHRPQGEATSARGANLDKHPHLSS
jgi:hypothetical protein